MECNYLLHDLGPLHLQRLEATVQFESELTVGRHIGTFTYYSGKYRNGWICFFLIPRKITAVQF